MELQENHLNHAEQLLVRSFLLGEPVIKVTSKSITGVDTFSIRKAALSWAAQQGEQRIQRQDIGEIIFNKAGVKNSLAHSFYQKKIDTIPAIPTVLAQGKIIAIVPDFDGKPIMNLFLAAPVQVDAEKQILVVRLRRHSGAKNQFYVHDVYALERIQKESDTFKPGGSEAVGLSRSIALVKNILWNILTVKE
jgi:hypothetical protein